MSTIGAWRAPSTVGRIEAESVLPLAPSGFAVASGVVECVVSAHAAAARVPTDGGVCLRGRGR